MEIKSEKYLTFYLNEEEYGIPILRVKEIIGMMEITSVPRTPKFIKGVINLRGKIISTMDLRIKFGLEEKPYAPNTCIIVVEVNTQESKKQMGIIVDAVSEVIKIDRKDIELPNDYGQEAKQSYITGIGKLKDKVIMLISIDEILNKESLGL